MGVVVALLCCLLALWVKYGEPYRKERKVIAHLISLPAVTTAEPYGPLWLQKLLGAHAPLHVTSVEYRGARIADADLKELRRLPRLRELLLYDTPGVTDAGLAEIGAMPVLEHLAILSPKLTDRGISHLRGLTKLRRLELPHQITDAAMVDLQGLVKLETLICAAQTPAQQRIIAALEEKTEADFREMPLDDVVQYFQQRHDIPINIYELQKARMRVDVPVTLQQRDETLGVVLRRMLTPAALDWKLDPNSVSITTQEVLSQARPRLTQLREWLPNLTVVIVDWDVPALKSPFENTTSEQEDVLESWLRLGAILNVGGNRSLRVSFANTKADDLTLLGAEKIAGLKDLDLRGTRITNRGLISLTALNRLASLDLSETGVNDEGMDAVARLTSLTDLRLYRTSISDAGLAKIARLSKLARLDIGKTLVAGPGLRSLNSLVALESLRLEGVGDDGLAYLSGLARLRRLSLIGPRITDNGMSQLVSLAGLEDLHLGDTAVTEHGLSTVSKIPMLKSLSLSGAKLTGESPRVLLDFDRLAMLRIGGTIGDANVKQIGRLAALRTLSLSDRGLSDECLPHLAGLANIESLSLVGAAISDDGLERFPELPTLRWLDLIMTKVTPDAVADLQRRMPRLKVRTADGTEHAPREAP
ncbi:MAG TPA: hypothetical protein VFI31_14205 [Pirellulales bacterium]|nr:hypothetical protein [Pirellulales bacterium]